MDIEGHALEDMMPRKNYVTEQESRTSKHRKYSVVQEEIAPCMSNSDTAKDNQSSDSVPQDELYRLLHQQNKNISEMNEIIKAILRKKQ